MTTVLALLVMLLGFAGQQPPQPVRVVILTDAGEIEADIDVARAPITATNFLKYVDAGFFDGGRFFRTVRPDNQVDKPVKIAVIQAAAQPRQAGAVLSRRFRSSARTPPASRTRTERCRWRARRLTPPGIRSPFASATSQRSILAARGSPTARALPPSDRSSKGWRSSRKIQMGPADGETLNPAVAILSVRRR